MLEETVKERARSLINTEATPFYKTYHDFQQAMEVLGMFRKERSTDPEIVNLSIHLMERLVKEVSINKEVSHFAEQRVWLGDPKCFAPIFSAWKKAAEKGGRVSIVVSPKELLQKLKNMSIHTPEFRYNTVTFGVILGVAIKQAPSPKDAPRIADELLEHIKQEASRTNRKELKPNLVIYSQILHCWAKSGLPETGARLDAIFQCMRAEGLAPDTVAYTILLPILERTREYRPREIDFGNHEE